MGARWWPAGRVPCCKAALISASLQLPIPVSRSGVMLDAIASNAGSSKRSPPDWSSKFQSSPADAKKAHEIRASGASSLGRSPAKTERKRTNLPESPPKFPNFLPDCSRDVRKSGGAPIGSNFALPVRSPGARRRPRSPARWSLDEGGATMADELEHHCHRSTSAPATPQRSSLRFRRRPAPAALPNSRAALEPLSVACNSVQFVASSFGGSTPSELRALAALAHAYGRRIHTDPRALPVVELRTGSERRGMMRIHHPKFEVVGWPYPDAGSAGEDVPPPNTDAPLLKTV
jgi:hypothetical protein